MKAHDSKRMRWGTGTSLAVALFCTSAPIAVAIQRPINGGQHCPDIDHSSSWMDYISGRIPPTYWKEYYGHTVGGLANPYGAIFPWAKEFKDAALNGLATNRCYIGGYHSAKRDPAQPGFVSYGNNGPANVMTRLPGDPSRYEININGEILIYTADGYILDHRGRRVGMLTCWFNDAGDCANY
jgi:hypothetical protein